MNKNKLFKKENTIETPPTNLNLKCRFTQTLCTFRIVKESHIGESMPKICNIETPWSSSEQSWSESGKSLQKPAKKPQWHRPKKKANASLLVEPNPFDFHRNRIHDRSWKIAIENIIGMSLSPSQFSVDLGPFSLSFTQFFSNTFWSIELRYRSGADSSSIYST